MPRRSLYLGMMLLSALAATGCRSRARYDPAHSPVRIERYERRLIEVAAHDSGCSPVQVQPVRIGELVWVANTCTGPREYFLDCRSRYTRWAHCRWDRVQTVNEAAANVLGCPPHAIAQLPGSTPANRLAQGCGMQVSMSLRCNEIGCGWIADDPPAGGAQVVFVPPP